MSVVFETREMVVGPAVGYQGDGAPAAYVRNREEGLGLRVPLEKGGENEGRKRVGFCLESSGSSESSSIGLDGGDSSGEWSETDGEEVESESKGGLGCMGGLEEALPIKRGLSNFFSGKSKSFANLEEVTSVKSLGKPENPYNKRRRIQMACKSRGALYSTSLPLLEQDHKTEEEEEAAEKLDKVSSPTRPVNPKPRKFRTFKSPRSHSLTDLGGV